MLTVVVLIGFILKAGCMDTQHLVDGKHIKRCIEAYVTMYLALFSNFLQDALNDSSIDLNANTTELESLLKIFIETP